MEKERHTVTVTLKFDSLFDPETPIEKGRRIIVDMLKDRISLDPQDIEIEGLK
jgi:hypothetical protein